MELSIAYKAGRAARALGKSIYSNPYPFNPECEDKRNDWDKGFMDEDLDRWEKK